MGGKRIDISSGTKPCAKCKEIKALSEFGVSKFTSSGFSSYCKPCMAEQARKRRATPEGKKAHYEANLRAATKSQANVPDGHKTCPRCNISKPFAEYPKNKYAHHGIATYCLPCSAAIVRARRATPEGQKVHREASKRWREANKERHADNHAKWLYGVDHGTYDEILAKQEGKCAICGTNQPGNKGGRFHIDHCHSSNQVRGLLCSSCNLGLGKFKDDVHVLERAIRYLAERGIKRGS